MSSTQTAGALAPPLRRTISPNLLRPRPMELGKIKIGGKGKEVQTRRGATMRLPEKFDHFVITTRQRGSDENFVIDEEIHSILGPEPESLDVRLMFDSVEENFQSEMLVYKGREKVFVCDGERARNLHTGNEGPCLRAQGRECPCKPFGRLAVILEAAPHYGGFYLFRTTSWETINNLQTTLTLLAQFGSLRGLPLRLVIYPATDTHEAGTSTSYKVGIVLRADYETARNVALEFHRADRIERRELKLLAAGVEEVIQEGEELEAVDIDEEFLLDPTEREEADRIRHSEEVRAKTKAQVEEIKARLAKKKEPEKAVAPDPTPEPPVAVDDGQDIADSDFSGEYGIQLPDWDKNASIPANADEGPDADTEPEPPEPEPKAGEAEKSSYEKAKAAYFVVWNQLWGAGTGDIPPLANILENKDDLDVFRANWQEDNIGKRSASRFSEEDFRKAAAMLREGIGLELEAGLAPPSDAPPF